MIIGLAWLLCTSDSCLYSYMYGYIREGRPLGPADGAEPLGRDALGRERRRLDFDGQAQLHHLEHVADRAQALGIDAEGHAAGIGGDEGSRALAGGHQALRTQGRHRLAHDGAADTHALHQFLLGRQARAGLEPPLADLLGDARNHLLGEIAGRTKRAQQSELVSAVGGG